MDLVTNSSPMSRAVRGHLAWLTAGGVLAVVSLGLLAQGRWLVGLGTLGLAALSLAWYLVPGRKLAFALGAVALSTTATLASVAGLDVYMHYRYARGGGYNAWGYRGDALGRKQPGERRVEMLGGSVTFGYGVMSDETIPAYLQAALNHDAANAPRWVVANLGWNSEGAYSFQYTLKDYEYLRSDVAILYSGYNDLGYNNQVYRRESAVFRLTGYLPILPIVPLSNWLRIETLGASDRGKVMFTPRRADEVATEAADAALRVSQALERQLGRLVAGDVGGAAHGKGGRLDTWAYYVQSVRQAITVALAQGKRVIVVTEPFISDVHVEQQEALADMMRTEFGEDQRVRYRNAGLTIDLNDRAMCWDGMHLTAAGNKFVAEWLAPDIEEILR